MHTQHYLVKTNELLERFRERQLGLDRQLDDYILRHLVRAAPERKAAYLAQRLLFILLRDGEQELQTLEIGRAQCWLYEVLLYLFEHCRWEDQTYSSLLKLIGLSADVRAIMFEPVKKEERFEHLRTDTSCPIDKNDLEAVFVELMPWKEREKRLEELRKLVQN